MCLGCIRFPTKSRAIFFLFSKNGNRTPQKSFSKRNFIRFANTIKEISYYILTNSYYFFFFFLVHMRILRERDKENFCFRKQKLKASVKSKIEIKLYYLKIPYLESRIPKIPSREKGRGETEIERERVGRREGRKYSVTYLHDRLRKQFRSGEEPVRVSTYVSRNVSFSKGSKRDENIHSLSVSLRAKERDEIKSCTVIAVFFSGGSRAYTSGVLAPAISRPTPPLPLSVSSCSLPLHFRFFLFVQRIPGDATRAIRRFEKRITVLSRRSACRRGKQCLPAKK